MPATKTTFLSAIVSAAIIIAVTLLPDLAIAYVGPGAAISALGALWGLIVGIVVALAVILFWPIRVLIRKLKQKNAVVEQQSIEPARNDGKPSQSPTLD